MIPFALMFNYVMASSSTSTRCSISSFGTAEDTEFRSEDSGFSMERRVSTLGTPMYRSPTAEVEGGEPSDIYGETCDGGSLVSMGRQSASSQLPLGGEESTGCMGIQPASGLWLICAVSKFVGVGGL
jgi:hypothetical protein